MEVRSFTAYSEGNKLHMEQEDKESTIEDMKSDCKSLVLMNILIYLLFSI